MTGQRAAASFVLPNTEEQVAANSEYLPSSGGGRPREGMVATPQKEGWMALHDEKQNLICEGGSKLQFFRRLLILALKPDLRAFKCCGSN